ncbi:MAG: class I SAM-dependent methyltransferase, partial [bacterium]
TDDYDTTLKCWQNRFRESLPFIQSMDFSQKFLKMWNYYFRYCEGGFREKITENYQFIFQK